MLNSLFPTIDWKNIQVVGFDLDGTLYDEFDFITQVYKPISKIISSVASVDEVIIYNGIVRRWLEKGSSFNRIFSEPLEASGIDSDKARNSIDDCVSVFRSFQPSLSLSARTRFLLNIMRVRYRLFLVTDGSCALQQAKFSALGLEQWFDPENVVISGCLGNGYEKPSKNMLSEINIFGSDQCKRSSVVYFGDREVDRLFAKAAGFQYVRVTNMVSFPELC